MQSRIAKLLSELKKTGHAQMRNVGSSMEPVIPDGSILTYEVAAKYHVGDVVCCRIGNRYIDAHRIIEKPPDGRFLIANNVGKINGWAEEVFAKVIEVDGIKLEDE